ncbi:hypothetical protein A2592_02710 [Candidatus Kaiserbacteria bacterium RIFOXYD1_FULL_42_15]|uniref:Lipid/polyisoprenoid-binding YceI-like domain-containing protein n=1 Tax=Candidatus Kaiserbacteria bacterium RIFOXYD1_FULL_42_15 TaxID=1798532 RepID=A0A1F6FSC4_9BACT|nr:MAG: hypothetical protein A2592_02710 [Candidatus Kaiserbacteria bacterium RIFOXYD1_FULL_42_15]
MVAALAVGGWFYFNKADDTDDLLTTIGDTNINEVNTQETTNDARQVVTPGSYSVDISTSEVRWAGKKPLIDGYINSGTIGLTEGTITVSDDVATGSFTIDMNTLAVGSTAKKPGKESLLEGHLKGTGWFNVAEFPTALFVITKVTPRADSDVTFEYDVTGDLTMKDVTNEISFPATIYESVDGNINVEAVTVLDRTKWGITSMSGSFFDDLADNVIDDNVQLSFSLKAEKD